MSWKSFVTGYLTFSRKDRIGVIMLVLLIVILFALPYLAPSQTEAPIILDDSLLKVIDSTQASRVAGYRMEKRNDPDFDYSPVPSLPENDFTKGALFAFDPNTLDADGWRKLGLRDKTIRTLLNYRSKGGRFYKPEDLQKVWGLPEGFYGRVQDYIHIAPKEDAHPQPTSVPPKKEFKTSTPKTVDINTADTTAFIALPGIGSKLAGRIVNFRNKLGGFISVDQVGATYGLPDSTFQKIKPLLRIDETAISQININTATKEQLSAHPYINWKLAQAIVSFRDQHGNYQTVDDLKKILILEDAVFETLKPYVSVQ